MRRETANVLLLLLAGALLKLAWSGDYLRYVKPQHQWWMIAGGLAILLLGGVAIVRDIRSGSSAAEHDEQAHDEHAHGSQRSAWLLLLPVLAVLFIAPPALGADSVSRSMDTEVAPNDAWAQDAYPPLPTDEMTALPVSAFQARSMFKEDTLVDREVELTGFVVREKGEVYIARMVIGCCAADGYPVTVKLHDASGDLAGYDNDDWIAVTGEYVPADDAAKEHIPGLQVQAVEPAEEPADPYEY